MRSALPVANQKHWRSLTWVFRAVQVRLRFLAALAVAFLIVARWDVLRTYWDRWTAPAPRDASMGAVSALTEYFCPMDPGVLSGWPGKCPICHMALVRRSKGDMGPLPSGVIARVQLSPDRILLAGLRSEPARYLPLAKEVHTVGLVTIASDRATIRAEIGLEEASWLGPDQPAEVAPDPPDGTLPVPGKIRSIEASSDGPTRLVVEVLDPSPAIRSARYASITVRALIAGREPFRSIPRGEPPIRPGEPRSLQVCPDHPEVIRVEPGRCPKDEKPLERLPLAKNQRVAWWCPMHPKVIAEQAGSKCSECGGMLLVPRVISYCPIGEVLAVPESAVIDTGSRTVVYVERMPGMFDGVEVRLGPRSGGFYPVVEGLEAGQSVAVGGAFLVDAETRLNPSLAAGYFGARRSEATTEKPQAHPETPNLGQGTCPVTGKKLGSMGTPVRVVVQGRAVFLCCEGCEAAIKEAPDKYLKPSSPAHHPSR
jgi:membrane fusion protein, copper/silver efflux system